MIYLKTDEEIELLRENNILVSETLAEVGRHIRPGVTTKFLDSIAEDFIRAHGAVPAFLGYQGFPASLCISVNEQVVHGIPSSKCVLKEGDIVSVDCGTFMKGFVGDSAYTFAVGEVAGEVRQLMDVTKEALYKGTAQAVVFERDGWTVRTRDHKPAAHYEFAVAVRKSGPDVLTDFSIIEKAINN